MFISETKANLPSTVYPFRPCFDKQTVSEVNATYFKIALLKSDSSLSETAKSESLL